MGGMVTLHDRVCGDILHLPYASGLVILQGRVDWLFGTRVVKGKTPAPAARERCQKSTGLALSARAPWYAHL